jgi:hypothetical protein
MNQAVVDPLKHKAERLTRWLICLIPLIFSGCFDSQTASEKSEPATGIAVLSRFFPQGDGVSERTSDSSGISEIAAFMPGGASSLDSIADEYPELIAVPDSLGASQNPFQTAQKLRSSSPAGLESADATRRRSSSLNALAALTLNGSFNQLFSAVFKRPNEDSLAVGDEFPNPFTEAKEKESASQQDSKQSQAEKPEAKEQNTVKDSKPQSAGTQIVASAGGAVPEYALILGNLDGSGALACSKAARISDTKFVSSDGEREFDLSINPDAAETQSAFYIDDLNGDGIPDLLVTSRPSLFGGVLLGDGNGGYQLADKFVTGYEPTVPSAGPFWNGKREIVTVNTRTGELFLFQTADQYRKIQRAFLPFIPDYLLHLVKSETSADFLLTSKIGGAKQLLSWKDDGTVEPSPDVFGADPFAFAAAIGGDSVQAYQTGNYASIVLISQGHSFNVANMRLFPNIFLVIGDLQRNGLTDVAVGNLKSFTPVR